MSTTAIQTDAQFNTMESNYLGGSTPEQRQAVKSLLAPFAMQASKQTGVPTSVIEGMAIQETGWLTSGLYKQANNPFGVKAGKDWTGDTYTAYTTEQDASGKSKVVSATFRKYDSLQAAFDDLVSVLNQPNYANAKTSDPYESITAIKADGYATDVNYAKHISDIIEGGRLYMQDSGAGVDPKTGSTYVNPYEGKENNTKPGWFYKYVQTPLQDTKEQVDNALSATGKEVKLITGKALWILIIIAIFVVIAFLFFQVFKEGSQ